MEYTDSTGFHAVMRITEGTQSFFYASEKALVKEQTVDPANVVQLIGHGKHDMKMLHVE
jgi:hypothetical protein